MATDQSTPFWLCVKNDQGLRCEEYREFRQMAFARQGVLRQRDGRWLSLDYRLVNLQTNFVPEPRREDLLAALKAAKASDNPAFRQALEVVSIYFPRPASRSAGNNVRGGNTNEDELDFNGLCTALEALTEETGADKGLRNAVQEKIASLKAWTPRATMNPAATQRTQSLISNYVDQAQAFLRSLNETETGPLEISPRVTAD